MKHLTNKFQARPDSRVTDESSKMTRDHQHPSRRTNEWSRSNPKKKHNPQVGSKSWAKKRIRDIERRFKLGKDIPADVRNELDRELATHRATLLGTKHTGRRSAMIKKYHMVRFFGASLSARELLAVQLV